MPQGPWYSLSNSSYGRHNPERLPRPTKHRRSLEYAARRKKKHDPYSHGEE